MKPLCPIFVLLLSFTFVSSATLAHAENPSRGAEGHSFAEAFKKCRENPNDAECAKRREERREKFAALKQKCQENPSSEFCAKMKERQENRREMIAAYCQEHPSDERCTRFNNRQSDKARL